MDNFTYKQDGDTLYFYPSGRIDSNNAPQVEAEVDKAFAECACDKVIIDADDLKYISSAGLRVILHIRKTKADTKIINASSEVYEIFDMTGFTEMIPVEKGYRKIDVDGCEVIGEGANGKVYRLDPDTIIKVYLNPDSLPDIQKERDLARRAFVLGVPTAIPYDVVRVGDGYGSVFELLNATSVGKMLEQDPTKVDEAVDIMVNLLKIIHGTEVKQGDMPDMKQVALKWCDFLKPYLDPEKWTKLHNMIDAVPESNMMLHGDYHIKNVMMQNGESLLIDMDTLCHGDKIFEFASIYNAYVGFYEVDGESDKCFLGISTALCKKLFDGIVEKYFGIKDPEKIQKLVDKMRLMGLTRIMRRHIRRNGIDGENKKYFDYYKKSVEELIDKVDTLELN